MREDAMFTEKPSLFAFDASVAHAIALLSVVFCIFLFIFLASTNEAQRVGIRFGIIVYAVCAFWSATLAARSIWFGEDDDRAWYVLGACLAEINVPLVICIPTINGSNDAPDYVIAAVEMGVPLWLPMLSFIAVAAFILARWRLSRRERLGEKLTRRQCIRTAFFWTGIVSLPVLVVSPVLIFLYALAPARAFSYSNAPVPFPTGWRAGVLEHSPRAFTDVIARGVRALHFRTFSESLQAHGLTSSDYLIEIIESEKGRYNNKGYIAYCGLQIKYPDVALKVSRKVWAECASGDPDNRLGMPAHVFSRMAEQSELRQLLQQVPGKDDRRRAVLLERLAWNKREDVSDAIQRIAEDRHAPDRFDAICALAAFRKPEQLKPLWFDFLDTASVQQHTASVRGLRIPSELLMDVSLRALEDRRPIVLRCWLLGIYFGDQHLYSRWPLALRALELSEHPDLRIRRGALHVLSGVFDWKVPAGTIPMPHDDQEYTEPWWENDNARMETTAEWNLTDSFRENACEALDTALK